MALTKMKKAFIIGHQSNRQEVMATLQRLGVMEIKKLEEEDLPFDEIPAEIHDSIENKILEMARAIQFLSRFDETKKSIIQQFAGSKILMEESTFLDFLRQEKEANDLRKRCQELEERLNAIDNDLSQIREDDRDLRIWKELDIPLEDLASSERIGIFCGILNQREIEPYQEDLGKDLKRAIFLPVGEGEKIIPFLIFYLHEDKERLLKLNEKYQLNEVSFPFQKGTIQENRTILEAKEMNNNKEREAILREIKNLLDKKLLLLAHHDAALLEREQYTMARTTGNTEELFVMEGWVRQQDEEDLKEDLLKISSELIYESRPPQEGEDPPVSLNNPSSIRPFEVVTQLYGTPNNLDLDPTIIMAPFFFVFFGLCLTDAGYGIVLSLLSLLALKSIRMAGMAKKLFQLLFLGGIATFILGVLTGGWFGDLIPIPDIWFVPIDDPLYFLVVSLILGVIHVYVGLFVLLYKNLKNQNRTEAFLSQGVWILFITGLLLKFVLPIVLESNFLNLLGNLGTYLGGATLILTQGRHQKNPIARLGSGILSLYDLVGYISDVLSYSRLLALGLATSVIAMVINEIAQTANTIPVIGFLAMVLIMIIGHLFNLIINLISSYVHTSRLQYVEFFSKFFDAGGKAFSPFGIHTDYLDLELQKDSPLLKPERD